jgi:peptidoglycan-associated lipoprotein
MKKIINKILVVVTALFFFGCSTTTEEAKNETKVNPDNTNQPIVDNTLTTVGNETISKEFGDGKIPGDFVSGEKIAHNFGHVYFAFDSAVVRPEESEKLKMLAAFLESNPNLYLVIEGHCDERGSEEYNRALSEKRALSVKDYIEKNSKDLSARINTIGFGEEKLVDIEKTDLAHAKNRRAEFVIISKR